MLQPMSHLMDNLHESSIIRPVLAMQHLSRPWKVGIGAVDALQLHSMTEFTPACAEHPELAEQASRQEVVLHDTASQ